METPFFNSVVELFEGAVQHKFHPQNFDTEIKWRRVNRVYTASELATVVNNCHQIPFQVFRIRDWCTEICDVTFSQALRLSFKLEREVETKNGTD